LVVVGIADIIQVAVYSWIVLKAVQFGIALSKFAQEPEAELPFLISFKMPDIITTHIHAWVIAFVGEVIKTDSRRCSYKIGGDCLRGQSSAGPAVDIGINA
jgi:hypothetical protein